MELDLRWFPKLESTHDKARELAQGGCAEGVVVVAGEQAQGRGRRGRSWVSEPGGLYMSVVLRPKLGMSEVPFLSFAGGIAVAERLMESGAPVRLKWPNDLLLNGKKVGGILCESLGNREQAFALVGVGINLSQAPERLPSRPIFPASTLLEECGLLLEARELVPGIFERLTRWIGLLVGKGFEPLRRRFVELSAHGGLWVELHDRGERFVGQEAGLSERGALRIATEHGTRSFVTGDLSRISESPWPT